MDVLKDIQQIQNKFSETKSPATIPLLKGGTFTARIVNEGVEIDNLGIQPFIPWAAFQEAVCILIRMSGRAERGNAMNYRLGDPNLSLDSIEGHIVHIVYGKQIGDTVFRRITPIACILIWAGICRSKPNELVLL
jgi:hypothetical protein